MCEHEIMVKCVICGKNHNMDYSDYCCSKKCWNIFNKQEDEREFFHFSQNW